jgi:hypothetical protein
LSFWKHVFFYPEFMIHQTGTIIHNCKMRMLRRRGERRRTTDQVSALPVGAEKVRHEINTRKQQLRNTGAGKENAAENLPRVAKEKRRWFGKRPSKAAKGLNEQTKGLKQPLSPYGQRIAKDPVSALINSGQVEYDSDTLVEAVLVEAVEAVLVVSAEAVMETESKSEVYSSYSWGGVGSATATISGGICTGLGASSLTHGAVAFDLLCGGGIAIVCGLAGVAYVFTEGRNSAAKNEEEDGLLPCC